MLTFVLNRFDIHQSQSKKLSVELKKVDEIPGCNFTYKPFDVIHRIGNTPIYTINNRFLSFYTLDYVNDIINILSEIKQELEIDINIPIIITDSVGYVDPDAIGINVIGEDNYILIQYPKIVLLRDSTYKINENKQLTELRNTHGVEYIGLYVLLHELAHYKDYIAGNLQVNDGIVSYKGISTSDLKYWFIKRSELPWEVYAHNEAMKALKKVKHLWKIKTERLL